MKTVVYDPKYLKFMYTEEEYYVLIHISLRMRRFLSFS